MNSVKMTCFIILYLTLSICAFYLFNAIKWRRINGAKNFIILISAILFYNSTYIMELNSTSVSQALFWYRIEHIAVPLLFYFWFLICMDITILAPEVKKMLRVSMSFFPITYYLMFYSNPFHHQYDITYKLRDNGFFYVLLSEKGIIYYLYEAAGLALVVGIIFLYLSSSLKTPRIFRNSYILAIPATLIPWGAGMFNQLPWNTLNLDFLPVSLIISSVLYSYGVIRFNIMQTIPIAHKMIYDQSKDGIMLLDMNETIIDYNYALGKIFPEFVPYAIRYPFSEFLRKYPCVKECIAHGENTIWIKGEKRCFTAEMVDILEETGTKIGTIILFHDVTLFAQHQERLELSVKEAVEQAEMNEMAFLQAQINPHFLNNTLMLISSMIKRDPDRAKEMIVDMSEYLMNLYQFESDNPMHSLREELDFTKAYVSIEQARFMERLRVTVPCGQIPDIQIPRLVIQPLVENAIRHGVLKKAQGGTVDIFITQFESSVEIKVKDDGIGIMPEKIPNLLIGKVQNQGVGIVNIQKRLNRHFGSGLSIESNPGQGTCVSFQVPCI